jgi:hypothetical protein
MISRVIAQRIATRASAKKKKKKKRIAFLLYAPQYDDVTGNKVVDEDMAVVSTRQHGYRGLGGLRRNQLDPENVWGQPLLALHCGGCNRLTPSQPASY